MKNQTTIASIATALGKGAISIIRLSGEESITIVNKIFKGANLLKVKSHTIHYGHIVDRNNKNIDEVLVSVFKAPKTYTKEDVVEINCHGGIFVTNKVLELLLENGAQLATAGEFTKRAFLNGRIDLTQAEAVMDMIKSETDRSLKCANISLKGEVKRLIKSFQEEIMDAIMKMEVNIDYPEYNDEFQVTNEYLKPKLTNLNKKLDDILQKTNDSIVIKEGIKTVIIGKPNVGKSSLLNALLDEEKAIVTSIAGTTRDVVEGKISINGVILNLVDTAGIHNSDDVVEKIGIEKSKKLIKEAELVLLMLDNSKELEQIDNELLKETENKKRIVIINKCDLNQKLKSKIDALYVSVNNKDDIVKIKDAISNMCIKAQLNDLDATYIGNTRQISLIKKAKESIEDAINSINYDMTMDIISSSVREAYLTLGEIIGEGSPDEIIDKIFENFCLGK